MKLNRWQNWWLRLEGYFLIPHEILHVIGYRLVSSFVMGVYTGTAIPDFRNAYLLIIDKPWHSQTPFDIFFWPIIDWEEIRKKVSTAKDYDEQN